MDFTTGTLKGFDDEDVSSNLVPAAAASASAPKNSTMKIKRVKSSDMLRMQIDEMMFDAEEKDKKIEADRAAERAKFEADLETEKAKFYADMAEQKAKFDADVVEQKAKADADKAEQKSKAKVEKEYLRARINELRGEVQAAEKAKAVSDAKLHSVSSNDLSVATKSTASEERLQKQADDGKAEREALEEKITAMQAEMDEAAKRKEAAKAAAKRDKDAAYAAKLALEKQIGDLRREMEETEYSKYLIGQELEEAKRMSSDSNSSTDASDEKVAELEKQLKDLMASKKAEGDAGAAREAKLEADAVAQKVVGDVREKELHDRLAALLEEADEAKFKKITNDEQGQAIKEELERQVRALQMEVESAMSAKKKSDVEKDAAVSAKLKSDKDKDAAVSELDRVRESSSNESSSEEVSDLKKQLFKMKAKNNDLRTERALIESFAIAREEEDRDEMDRAREDKERAVEEKVKEVEALRAEVQSVMTAKLKAEQERDMAISETVSSVTGFTDERALALEMELEELLAAKEAVEEDAAARERELEAAVVKQKADYDVGAAREKELKDQVDGLLEKAHEAKSRKLIADGEHKAAMDEAVAKEGDLMKRLKFLQKEVEQAVFDKHLADEELGKLKSSSASQSDASSAESTALAARLKASEDEVQALKDAAVKDKTDRDVELKASKDASNKEHQAQMDELQERLLCLQSEVDSAVFAKILAESEMDKAMSPSSFSSSVSSSDAEKIAMLRKELYNAKIASKAKEDASAARERKLASDLQTIKEEADTAAKASSLVNKEEMERLVKALQDETQAKLKAEKDLDRAISDSESSGTGSSDAHVSSLQKELDNLRASKSASDQAGAAREKKLESDVAEVLSQLAKMQGDADAAADAAAAKASADIAEMAALKDAAAKDKATSKKEHKAQMDELQEKLQALQGEVDSAVLAKILAESEMDKAMSTSLVSSSVSSSDAEKIAMLRKELYHAKIASKAKEDAGAARERKLASDLQTIKEKADTAAKAPRDDALATSLANKEEVERLAKALQDETQAKLKAEKDLDRATSDSASSAASSSDAHVSSLQKELDNLRASKSASDQAGAAREKKLETDVAEVLAQLAKLQKDADAAADAAAAKASVDIAEIVALKDVAAKAKATSKKEHKAEMDELQEKLKALQGEVETAVFAKVLAESELDKAMSSSVSSGSPSEVEKIALLRKELYNAKIASKAKEDAGAARERKLASDLETIQEDAGTAALANKEEIEHLVKALQDETQARHEAEKELQRNTSDSASSAASSSDAHVSSLRKELDDIKASKSASDRAGAARERKLETDVAEGVALKQKLQNEKKALLAQLEKMQKDADKATFDKKASMDKAAASEEKMQQRLKFLQEEMDAVVYEKHIADMEVDRLKTSPSSQTGGSDSDVVAAQLRAEVDDLKTQKKLDSDKATQEKTWADAAMLQLKEELGLLQEQAAVLSRGKEMAEDEVRALKVLSDGSTATPSDESPEAILLQKIEQLKSEKNLSYNIATTMKKQLESGKKNLQDRLDAMTSAKKEADDKLDAQNEKLSKEIKDLKTQKKADGLELQKKIDALEKELRNARSSSGGTGSDDGSCGKGQFDKLMHDLAEMKTEKDATEKRLAWEKSTKRDLRHQILALQERARAADKAKKISEDELRELQEQSETQSMEEVAEKLRQQVQSLQEEKGVTLQKLSELEEAVASGDLDFGEGGRVREAYVEKLKHDIEKLETSVDDLSSENKLLLDSKLRLEGEMSKDNKAKFISLDDEIRNLSRQTKYLTQKLGSARKEADDAKVAQKEEKDQVIDLQARMDKTILQLATIKSSTRVNMERIQGEHEQELKAVRDSSASLALHTENDELRRERDELRKALTRKKSVGTEQTLEDAESLTSAALAELRDVLRNAQEETAALKEETAALKGQMEEKDNQLVEKDSQLNKDEKEVSRLKHSLSEANTKNHDLERNIEAIKSKDEIFLSRIERGADAEKASLMKRIEVSEKAHADRMAHHEKENGTLRKKLESAEREIAELRASTGKQMQGSALPLQNGNSVDLLEVSQLRNDLKKERDQRKRAEGKAVSLKASMEQYDTTMDHMCREMVELRSKRDETVARLKDENQKLQKENQAMSKAGVRMPPALTSGDAPASTDLVSTVGRDLDSLILDLQGPPSGFATNGTNMLAPSQNGHAVPGAFRTNGMDARVSALQDNRNPSSITSASVSVQQMPYFSEELEGMISIANDYKLLYESKCVALKEVQMERNALRLELQNYCGTQRLALEPLL